MSDLASIASNVADVANYTAPALEKGLDILELLAEQQEGLTQQGVAARLSRSTNEIFRMLSVLERRGYLNRAPDGTYSLSLKLFELSHRHPPVKKLLSAALPRMDVLTRQSRQAAHLAIYFDRRIFVIAQVDSPEPMGFTVRMGTRFPVRRDRTSAWVLTAFQAGELREEMVAEMLANSEPELTPAELRADLASIVESGIYEAPSFTTEGILDISCPIFDFTGRPVAALTVPYLRQRFVETSYTEARRLAVAAATAISKDLGCQRRLNSDPPSAWLPGRNPDSPGRARPARPHGRSRSPTSP